MPRITPNLWFSTQSEEAVRYYIDALQSSYGGDGPGRRVPRPLVQSPVWAKDEG